MRKVKANPAPSIEKSDKEFFSIAVAAMSDAGIPNEKIASLLNASRNRVGAVMAWRRHRDSWMKRKAVC
jgi:hypothetical protein